MAHDRWGSKETAHLLIDLSQQHVHQSVLQQTLQWNGCCGMAVRSSFQHQHDVVEHDEEQSHASESAKDNLQALCPDAKFLFHFSVRSHFMHQMMKTSTLVPGTRTSRKYISEKQCGHSSLNTSSAITRSMQCVQFLSATGLSTTSPSDAECSCCSRHIPRMVR
jgi:hypothetical protein